jgi:hypothetical protein
MYQRQLLFGEIALSARFFLSDTSESGFAARVRLCTVKTYDNNKAKVDY